MAQWLGLHDFTAEGLGELSGTTEKKKKKKETWVISKRSIPEMSTQRWPH